MNGTILDAVARFAMSVENHRWTKKGNFKHPLSNLILCFSKASSPFLHSFI